MVEFIGELDSEIKANLNKVYNEVSRVLSLPKSVVVNLNFVNEKQIKQLNKTTRNIDKVTDVLTYPYVNLKVGQKLRLKDYVLEVDPENKLLTIGDIYICKERATEQAKEYNHTVNREFCFLFLHGLLHICGYDHINENDAKLMEAMQNKILNSLNITRETYKCGFVTIVGETNSGKSTLLNQLVGEHVAIVSPKSQTTRENIKGIYNDKTTQIVFVDTPGYHKRRTLVDEEMDKQISTAMEDTEIILMLIDANKPLVDSYNKLIKKVNSNAIKILLINKIDETSYQKLYPQIAELAKLAKTNEILPISALKGKNCDVLIDMIKKYLPTFNHEMRYYPIDEYTDETLRRMVAEIVREKALMCLDDEIPHGVQVVVTSFSETEKLTEILADLYCEKESHKAIILGKSGEMIKKISTMARVSIEKLLNKKVNLKLFVKVKANWRNDIKAIENFGLKVSE